jgi:hypothetical protein
MFAMKAAVVRISRRFARGLVTVSLNGAINRIHILEAQTPELLTMLAREELVIGSLVRGDQVLRLATDNQLSAQDFDSFLAEVLKSAVTIASATGGAITLLDDEDFDGNESPKLSSVISRASSASVPAAERTDSELYNRRFPIRTGTQLRGWLELSFAKETTPSSHTLIALTALADQIALTLRFFAPKTKTPEEVTRQQAQAVAERERIFEQIGNAGRAALRKLTERPKLDAYLEYVLSVASDQFAADGASVWLHDQETETVHLASRVDSPTLQERRLQLKRNDRSFRYDNGVLAKLAGAKSSHAGHPILAASILSICPKYSPRDSRPSLLCLCLSGQSTGAVWYLRFNTREN